MSVCVISCGLGEPQAHIKDQIATADKVYGSLKLLQLYAVPAEKSHALAKDAGSDAEALLTQAAHSNIVVLTSGDALFHGMGGTLARLASSMSPAPDMRFLPGVTAFQSLFARLGLPWDNASLFSDHRASNLSLCQILGSPLAVVYGGTRRTAAHLAKELLAVHPLSAPRRAVLADSLNTAQERIVHSTLGEIAKLTASPTSILVLLPDGATSPVLPLGLPVDNFEREGGLITAPDVRAVILSRLRLPKWGCLWDMGAGSGSVGLEAAALCPQLDVRAVERKAERAAMCKANAVRLGVGNHHTLCGDSLAEATALPDPDRIFIGGSANNLETLLDLCWTRLKHGGIIMLSAVTLETQHRAFHWHPERRTALVSVAVSEERPLAGHYHHLEPQHPIHLYCYTKPEHFRC